jgi:hypothetical protein
MVVLGEKLGGGLADRHVGDCVGSPFFLGAVGSIQLCWVSMKGCHVQGLFTKSVCVAYMD